MASLVCRDARDDLEALIGWIWIAATAVFIGIGVRLALRWCLHRFDGTHRRERGTLASPSHDDAE